MSELSIWMPLHIDAWQGSASVQQMTDAEHRAFLNLLMEAWQAEDCGLPSDDKELAKLSRKRAEWPQIREAVLDEFDLIDGRYYNAKLLKERRFANSARSKRGAGSSRRWGSTATENEQRGRHLRSQRMAEARSRGTHTDEEWTALVEHHGRMCVRCDDGGPVVKDHIRPIYQGGSDAIDNLQPLCRGCNSSKGAENVDHRKPDWRDCLQNALSKATERQGEGNATPSDALYLTPTPTPTPTQKTQRRGAPVCSLPEWVPAEAWERFAAMRKANRKPITAHAEGLLVAKLEQLRKEGHDPAGVLDQSTMNGWQGLFAIHVDRQGAGPRPEARVGVAAAPGVAATREMLDKHDELALNYWREMRERGSPRYAKECPASLKRKIEGEKAA